VHYTAIENGTNGKWYGRIIDLLGSITKANSREELVLNLENEKHEYILWLKGYNEDLSVYLHDKLIIKEEISNISQLGESGGTVALFEYDKRVVSSERLKYFFKLMEYSRKTLLELIKDIQPEKMAEQVSQNNRTIIQVLHHICNTEEWYKSRLGEEADFLYEKHLGISVDYLDQKPIIERLEYVRKGCLNVLNDLIVQKGAKIFTREAYTNYPEEPWTAHKVLRRFIEHEREHYYSIRTMKQSL